MVWTLCTSGAAIRKGGLNANSAITASGAAMVDYSNEAESEICDVARSDVVTNFATLTANGKQVMQNICSSMIGQKIINFDMSGYTSRNEAIMMLNVLENEIDRGIKLIKEDRNKTYLGIT